MGKRAKRERVLKLARTKESRREGGDRVLRLKTLMEKMRFPREEPWVRISERAKKVKKARMRKLWQDWNISVTGGVKA